MMEEHESSSLSLNIPAFMRKHELKRKSTRRKLLMTALDRKKAGLPPPQLKKSRATGSKIIVETGLRATLPQLKVMLAEPRLEYESQPMMKFQKSASPITRERRKKADVRRTIRQRKRVDETNVKQKTKPVAVVTHYLDKLEVAILKLASAVREGDHLIFESHDQLITSMQIDRKPVKRAMKNAEIGIKVDRPVAVGGLVYRKT
ncbi:MAG: hypothetical protein AAB592_00145 [Patescibacteria group bacterium]